MANNSPFIIPIFLPQLGCKQKCFYCDQGIITGHGIDFPTPEGISKIIEEALPFINKGTRKRVCELAFYGGNFTGLDKELKEAYLLKAKKWVDKGYIDSIRVSTRPDYIDYKEASYLKKMGVAVVEIGVPSMVDKVLIASGRGHSAKTAKEAAFNIKKAYLSLVIQTMIGLPSESLSDALFTAREVISLKPDGIRIYPVVVLKGTRLAKLYNEGKFLPLSYNQTVRWLLRILPLYKKAKIKILRIGLEGIEKISKSGGVIAGVTDPSLRQKVESILMFKKAKREFSKLNPKGKVEVKLFPKDISNFVGQKKKNIKRLEKIFPISELKIKGDERVKQGEIEVDFL
ncbi:MAG: radical SAM protein [Deltaproteobacteria bacterium]|nr:radical SAM protein [Deltaproteobacteria bacterium]